MLRFLGIRPNRLLIALAGILALTLPAGTFLAVSRPVGLVIIAVGLTVLIWYRRRQRGSARQLLD